MYAVATLRFGLSEEQFLDLTPLQFSYLSEEYDRKMYSEDFRAGIIASTIANCHSKKSWKPKDFMPKYKTAQKPKQSQQEMMMKAQMLNAMFGGTVNNKKVA